MSGLEPLMIAAIAGSAIQGAGTILGGIEANTTAKYEAKQGQILAEWERRQLEQQAKQDEYARAVRAREKRHESTLVQSAQLARAASSGGGVTNPTILNLMEDTAARGEYLAQTELAAGKMDAASRRHQGAATILGANMQGDILRMRGRSAQTGGILSGVGQTAAGISDTYARYRTKQPSDGYSR